MKTERKTLTAIAQEINECGCGLVSVASLGRHFKHVDNSVAEIVEQEIENRAVTITEAQEQLIILANRIFQVCKEADPLELDVRYFLAVGALYKFAFRELVNNPDDEKANEVISLWEKRFKKVSHLGNNRLFPLDIDKGGGRSQSDASALGDLPLPIRKKRVSLK